MIFSEIARRYIKETGKKVIILTHRIELCQQTSRMLAEFQVPNMIINSQVKVLTKKNEFMCYVAMVETLNNRLKDGVVAIDDIGFVIIDEAHHNSFRKLFRFFRNCTILGVTATPLSSNINLPMKDNYQHLLMGESISWLIEKEYLAKPKSFRYDVELGALKIGINGDYTVSSSERLYTNDSMQNKLIRAYQERALNKKTLIFNNGIRTSQQVYHSFLHAGYDVRHLDHHHSSKERRDILDWFKTKPNAILTSVSILTTGFDEPGVEVVILNRATRSLTLYFQMIGRGSRILKQKSEFSIIDLGNNFARFGPWDGNVDWQQIFKSPEQYYANLMLDEDIERQFRYVMPEDLRAMFSKSESVEFDITDAYDEVMARGEKPLKAIELSIEQHLSIVKENSDNLAEALSLARMLEHDIAQRVKSYSYCIAKSTLNYKRWLIDDYTQKLRRKLMQAF